jgi:hypothetical protein
MNSEHNYSSMSVYLNILYSYSHPSNRGETQKTNKTKTKTNKSKVYSPRNEDQVFVFRECLLHFGSAHLDFFSLRKKA